MKTSKKQLKPTSRALLIVSGVTLVAMIAIGVYSLREQIDVLDESELTQQNNAAPAASRIDAWTQQKRFETFLTGGNTLTDDEYRRIALEMEDARMRNQLDTAEYREVMKPQDGAKESREKWERAVADLEAQLMTLKSNPETSGSTDLIRGVEKQLEQRRTDEPLDEVN